MRFLWHVMDLLNEDGRIILQEKELMELYFEEPYEPINRVIAQKSVFVRHPDGFIQPGEDNIINIKSDLKQSVLIHLRYSHDISVETIYNDIHTALSKIKETTCNSIGRFMKV